MNKLWKSFIKTTNQSGFNSFISGVIVTLIAGSPVILLIQLAKIYPITNLILGIIFVGLFGLSIVKFGYDLYANYKKINDE